MSIIYQCLHLAVCCFNKHGIPVVCRESDSIMNPKNDDVCLKWCNITCMHTFVFSSYPWLARKDSIASENDVIFGGRRTKSSHAKHNIAMSTAREGTIGAHENKPRVSNCNADGTQTHMCMEINSMPGSSSMAGRWMRWTTLTLKVDTDDIYQARGPTGAWRRNMAWLITKTISLA